METTENNRLIAEFLGFKERVFINSKGRTIKTYSLPNPKTSNGLPLLKLHKEKSLNRYSSDWNWLMSVVEKIESLDYYVNITGTYTSIGAIESKNNLLFIEKDWRSNKIDATYNACISFIEWYNENK